MSLFENDQYRWRETYFVLFERAKRPTLKQIEKLLHRLSNRFQLESPTANDGLFESVTVLAPDDYAALDISFESGEEVLEQGASLRAELKESAVDAEERAKLDRLAKLDARFDLLHFEQAADSGSEDPEDMLDPSALLLVLDALVELTEGVGVDPQSGTLV